jgi:hypothetical protein
VISQARRASRSWNQANIRFLRFNLRMGREQGFKKRNN